MIGWYSNGNAQYGQWTSSTRLPTRIDSISRCPYAVNGSGRTSRTRRTHCETSAPATAAITGALAMTSLPPVHHQRRHLGGRRDPEHDADERCRVMRRGDDQAD